MKKINDLANDYAGDESNDSIIASFKAGYVVGFKAGLDAKSCCCNSCSLHSIALEEKMSSDCVGDIFNEDEKT